MTRSNKCRARGQSKAGWIDSVTYWTATLKFIDYNVAMTFILIIIIITGLDAGHC